MREITDASFCGKLTPSLGKSPSWMSGARAWRQDPPVGCQPPLSHGHPLPATAAKGRVAPTALPRLGEDAPSLPFHPWPSLIK